MRNFTVGDLVRTRLHRNDPRNTCVVTRLKPDGRAIVIGRHSRRHMTLSPHQLVLVRGEVHRRSQES